MSIKAQNVKQATFLLLDVFYEHKKHRAQNVKQVTFFFLDVFYEHKNAAFFVFVRLYAFCAFCMCEIFS